jgi:periplasmic divalent cation tolerance protein
MEPATGSSAPGQVKGEFAVARLSGRREIIRMLLLAWTTVGSREAAEQIAREVIALQLAACVQIDGPIVSHYLWQGQPERAEEYRLCLKFLETKSVALEEQVLRLHPYDTPEWIVFPATRVGEKYLSWATANSTSPPL